MYHHATPLALLLILLLSGCGLINAVSDPPEEEEEITNVNEPDVGHDDVGVPDVGHDDVGVPDVGHDDVGVPDVGEPDMVEPDAGEPDIGGPDVVEPDTDIDPPSCDIDAVQACDCEDLPDGIEGEQTCQSDGEWGDCVCPSLCEDPFDGTVAEGQPCGYCQQGIYSCTSDGVAECDVERGTNFCGGCEPHPVPSSCSGSDRLVCNQDETATCFSTSPVTGEYDFEAPGSDPEEIEIHYVFVAGDATEICDEEWELGAAADPPGAYQLATGYSASSGTYTMQLPATSISGALRTLIRRPVEVHDSDEPQVLTTHFDCTPLQLPLDGADEIVEINPEAHPALFRGTYQMSYNRGANSSAATDALANQVGFQWLLAAMQTFFANPGSLLTGCQQDCTHGSFASIVDHFDTVGPTLTIWEDFVAEWTEVMTELEPALIVEAYGQLMDDYAAQYQDIDSSWNFLRNGNFGFISPGDSLAPVRLDGLKGSAHYHWPTRVIDQIGAPENLSHEFGFGDNVPQGPCTGNECYPNTSPVPGPAAASIPTPVLNDDFSAVVLGEVLIEEVPFEEALIDIFFDYLPSVLLAQVVEEIDGELVTTSLQGWDDFPQLMRTIFPCVEVAKFFVEEGSDEKLADDFEAVCDQLYGTTEETTVLERILQFLPITSEHLREELVFVATDECTPIFEADAVHGLRFHSIRGASMFQGCRPERVELWSIPDIGLMEDFLYAFPVQVMIEAK